MVPEFFLVRGSISDSLTAVGDLLPQMSLRWNSGVNNWMVYGMGEHPGRQLNTFPVRFPRGDLHTLALATQQATREIPIVVVSGDPVGTGLVTSLNRNSALKDSASALPRRRQPIRRTLDCCARAANGHAPVAPPRSAMNARRLMSAPGALRIEPEE